MSLCPKFNRQSWVKCHQLFFSVYVDSVGKKYGSKCTITTGKNKFDKVYRTVQELGIQDFTGQSSTKYIELFIINIEVPIIFPERSALYIEKFYKFRRTLFCKCLYPQLLNSSISFTKLFFSVYNYSVIL